MTQKQSITVVIENLTEPQRLALEDLFATWAQLGSWGSSRWTAFFADGDGDFRPKVSVNGKKAEVCNLTNRQSRWKQTSEGEMYLLDFDSIAWAMNKTAKQPEPVHNEGDSDQPYLTLHFSLTREQAEKMAREIAVKYMQWQKDEDDWELNLASLSEMIVDALRSVEGNKGETWNKK